MENTKEMTTEYRMVQWAEKMAERVGSGLSIKAYCEREGMPTNRYHYWQRRLRAMAAKEMASMPIETGVQLPAGWIQAKTAEDKKAKSGEVAIEIGKCRVMANSSTDTELLAKVCRVLVELC
ncbi:MAG: hypothetical protein FWE49_07060 [Synergistaceae bacterium]|nr:hypothetical protein [Synergistaceae bacterium]